MRKKILVFVNSLANGGGEKAAADLANTFYAHNENISILIIEDKIVYNINKGIKINFNTGIKKNKLYSLPLIRDLVSSIHLYKIIKDDEVDTVISHLSRANYINGITRLFVRYDAILVTHGSVNKYKSKLSIKNTINLCLIKYILLSSYCKRIFLTTRMKESYLSLKKCDNNNVVTNCLNIRNIISSSECTQEEVNLPRDFFIFVGRLNKIKNVHDIISVFKEVKNESLVILGDGPELEYLRLHAGNSENIVFLGAKKNPYPIMKKAKGLILASSSEGFPNVLLESLSLNVPIITTDCETGPREILDINNTIKENYIKNDIGVLYAYKSISGLRAVIKDFSSFSFSKHAMSSRANEYDSNNIYKEYKKLIYDKS